VIRLIKNTFHREPDVKKKLIEFIDQTDRLSFGPQCEEFEKKFSEYQGRKHSIFVNSGSSANLALIQALINQGILQKGDKVGFSALTWATNVMPLVQLGLEPVPIDVELDTLNVSSRKLESILEKTEIKALFITNLLGFCDDMDVIKAICDREEIILIEDNCESLGTVYKGQKLGNFGLASTFSFYVGHHLSTIEGGMICTDDNHFADALRMVRAHGWDRNVDSQKQGELRDKHSIDDFYARYSFYSLAYNLRPTEINGFLGSIQVPYIDEIVNTRRDNFLEFAEIYNNTGKYLPIRHEHIDLISNFAVPVVCKTVEDRDDLIRACEGKVEIRPIVGGDITGQPFFKELGVGWESPNAALVHRQGLYFGNNQDLTREEIREIKEIFK